MLNKVQLIGRLGNDPEIKTLPNGEKLATFSLATSETWKDKNTGEKKENTEWHNISIFGALANVVEQYIRKGKQVYVEGKIKYTKSTDKDGIERYYTNIQVNNLLMLGSKDDSASISSPSNNHNQTRTSTPTQQPTRNNNPAVSYENNNNYGDDDIPF